MVNKLQFYAGLWIDDDNQLVLQPLTVGIEMFDNEYINASYIDVSLSFIQQHNNCFTFH